MQPIFQPPVTPNNGNPNTVYNQPKIPDLGTGYTAVPDSPLGPVPSPEFSTDEPAQPVNTARISSAAPQPLATPVPTFVAGPTAAPPAPMPTPSNGGGYASYAQQPQPAARDTRTTMGQWLPRFAVDTSSMGTQFGPGAQTPAMDYWRSRLQQITAGATQPVAAEPSPASVPAVAATPSPVPQAVIPDFIQPVSFGNVPAVSQPDVGANFSGLSAMVGLGGPEANVFETQVADVYGGLPPEQRAAFSQDVRQFADPATPVNIRTTLWQRIKGSAAAANKYLADDFDRILFDTQTPRFASASYGTPLYGRNYDTYRPMDRL